MNMPSIPGFQPLHVPELPTTARELGLVSEAPPAPPKPPNTGKIVAILLAIGLVSIAHSVSASPLPTLAAQGVRSEQDFYFAYQRYQEYKTTDPDFCRVYVAAYNRGAKKLTHDEIDDKLISNNLPLFLDASKCGK